jgi:hypothetical protein
VKRQQRAPHAVYGAGNVMHAASPCDRDEQATLSLRRDILALKFYDIRRGSSQDQRTL